ncbi:hypothetical protein [Brevibacillus reuszeri]|nr:hypothetical protein [Brevibacillus reuszeri]
MARRDTCMGASLDGSIAKARPAPKAVRRSGGAFRGEEKGENACGS